MQMHLGYSKWENFEKVIQKAKDACTNAGEDVKNHFPDVRKMVGIGSKTERGNCVEFVNFTSLFRFGTQCVPN